MGCGVRSPRTAVQAALAALNPAAAAHMAALAAAGTAEQRQHVLRVGTSDDAFGVVGGVVHGVLRVCEGYPLDMWEQCSGAGRTGGRGVAYARLVQCSTGSCATYCLCCQCQILFLRVLHYR